MSSECVWLLSLIATLGIAVQFIVYKVRHIEKILKRLEEKKEVRTCQCCGVEIPEDKQLDVPFKFICLTCFIRAKERLGR